MTKTIGIIAGNGRFPLLAAHEARKEGYRVVVCGIEREAEPSLQKSVEAFRWVKIGELKKLADFFRHQGVHEAIMAGKVEKVRLFQENVRPDFEMVKVIMRTRDFKDDSLLLGITEYLREQGIEILDSTFLLKHALPKAGILGKRKPSKEVMEDIRFGYSMAKSIAGLDIGQTVVIKKKAVMAVEAIEGTDQAIRRGGILGGGKVTVVKVAKPKQDMRFDVPAFGLKTLRELIAVKALAFAFEAEKTIIIDHTEVIDKANKAGIALVSLDTSGNGQLDIV